LVLAACAEEDPEGGLFETDGGFVNTSDSGYTGYTGGTGGTFGGGWDGSVASGGDSGAAVSGNGLPCEVQTILKDKCQTCHGDPLQSGPMPLITRADLLALNTSGAKISDRVKARIHDTTRPMPPVGRTPLTAADTKALDDYIAAGLPVSTASCGTGATGGTEGGGTTGGGTTGGGSTLDWQPPDSDCEVMLELRAHGGQTVGDTTPFTAPSGGDHYEIFYFKPTWTQKMHVIRIDPLIDNGAVLHHWLLYMEEGNSSGAGTHKSDSGLQSSSSQLLSGWAPGNKSIPLGREIGMQVIQGPNARFGIEIHYNTSANPAMRTDRSGARLCLTSKLRPKEAGTHWLGTQAIASLGIGEVTAGGRCTVQKESHIIAMSPHMHVQGKYMKSIVTKKDGSKVTITDKPFSFDDQQIFPINTPTGEIVVNQGDTIQTTCTYKGDKAFTFGPNTTQEMCYNFVVAWPSGSLSNGTPGAVGGKNTCIDPGT